MGAASSQLSPPLPERLLDEKGLIKEADHNISCPVSGSLFFFFLAPDSAFTCEPKEIPGILGYVPLLKAIPKKVFQDQLYLFSLLKIRIFSNRLLNIFKSFGFVNV
jgi:hypothetical protein